MLYESMFITSQWLSLELIKKFAHLQFRINIVDCSCISDSPHRQYLGQTDPASCGYLSSPGDLCTRIRRSFYFFRKLSSNIGIFHQLGWNNRKSWFSIRKVMNFTIRSLTKLCFATSALGFLDFTQFSRRSVFRFSLFFHLIELEVRTFWWRFKLWDDFP